MDNVNIFLNENEENVLLIRRIESFEDTNIVSSNTDLLFSISQELKVLPKLMEYRFPLLKIMKSLLYHSIEVFNSISGQQQQFNNNNNDSGHKEGDNNENDQQAVSSIENDQQVASDGGKKGSKNKNIYNKQSKELKGLSMKNNTFGDTYKNILQTAEATQRLLRLKNGQDAASKKAAERLAAEQLAGEKLAAGREKRRKAALLNRKRKSDQDAIVEVIGKEEQTPSLEANAEILALQAQIKALQQGLQSSKSIPIQAEVVVTSDHNTTKKPHAKRNYNKNKIIKNNAESSSEDALILEEEVNYKMKTTYYIVQPLFENYSTLTTIGS